MRIVLTVTATALGLLTTAPAVAEDADELGGPYVGIAGGIALPKDDQTGTVVFDRGGNGTFGETVTTSAGANAFSPGFCGGAALGNSAAGGCDDDGNSYDIGIRAGYDWPVGSNVIVGAVVEAAKTDISDSTTAFSTTPASYTFTRESDYVVALRGRIGFGLGTGSLVYATGGVAAAKMDNSFVSTNTANSFTQNNASDWPRATRPAAGCNSG